MADYEIADAAEWEEDAVPIDDLEFAALLPPRTSRPKLAPSRINHQPSRLIELDENAVPTDDKTSTALPPQRAPQPKLAPSRINPQQLQNSHEPTRFAKPGSPPKKRVQRRAPNLVADPDNDALVAWRSNKPPSAIVPLPSGFQGGRPKLARLNEISRRTGTHVVASDEQDDIVLRIWGTPEQVQAAQIEIENWIVEIHGPKKHGMWAHTPAVTPALRKRQEKKFREEAIRQAFRQAPPAGSTFKATGSFQWPKNDERPVDLILGRSLEAFDNIRMEYSCYITYDKATSMFKIMGDDANQVKQAMLRVRATYYQVIAATNAEDSDQQPATLLLQAPKMANLDTEIVLSPYPAVEMSTSLGTTSAGVFPRMLTSLVADHTPSDSVLSKTTWDANLRSLKLSVVKSLRRMTYFHGNLQMRVRLGTFLLMKYRASKAGAYTYDTFQTIVQESQVVTRVTEEIGDKDIEQSILARFLSASDMLFPQEALTLTLDAIKPVYAAIFNLGHPESEGNLRLDIEARTLADDSIERTSTKWTKLDKGKTDLQKLLNASLINLGNGSAWQLEICGGQNLDDSKLPRARRFPDQVKFLPTAARDAYGGSQFVKYIPTLPVMSLQQKTAWRFNLKNCAYVCELAKIQTFTPSEPSKGNPVGTTELTAGEPRWGVSVCHQSWNDALSEHSKLATGARAAWPAELDSFFPRDAFFGSSEPVNDGLDAFLRKLEEVERLVLGDTV